MILIKGAVFAKHMSHIFVEHSIFELSVHPYGSDNIFPLTLLYFPPCERGKEEKLHTSERLICMSAPLSRQRDRPGREAWVRGKRSNSAFQRLLTGFLLCRPRSLRAGSTHSSLWLQLMKHSCASVFPAPGTCSSHRSKPQQCVVANSCMPSLGRA